MKAHVHVAKSKDLFKSTKHLSTFAPRYNCSRSM